MTNHINVNPFPDGTDEDSTPEKYTLLNTDGEPMDFTKSEFARIVAARRKMADNPLAFKGLLDRYRKAAAAGYKLNGDGEKDRLSKAVADDGSDFKMSHDLFPIVIRDIAHKHPEILPAMKITKSYADRLYPDVRRAYDALHKDE